MTAGFFAERNLASLNSGFPGLKSFIRIPTCASTPNNCGKSRMQEICPCGSVRVAPGHCRHYRDSTFDRRDGWVGLSAARKITTESWNGILAKFQQQRTDAPLGVLSEVFWTGMLWVNRHGDRRSWTILMRYFLRQNEQNARVARPRDFARATNPSTYT